MIYVIYNIHNNEIIASYIFKNSNTKYKTKNIVECIHSLYISKTNEEKMTQKQFIKGFFDSINDIYRTNTYDIILIEQISKNDYFCNILKDYRIHILFESIAGFYLYNYSLIPLDSRDCCIIY